MANKSTLMQIDSINIQIVRKKIKNMYIRVLAPDGNVAVSAPVRMPEREIYAAVKERLTWIRKQQSILSKITVQPELSVVSGEIWPVWGKPCGLVVLPGIGKCRVELEADTITMYINPDMKYEQRLLCIDNFYRDLLKQQVPALMMMWESKIGVKSSSWHIKKMKTRWGSCNTVVGRIWLNLELAKQPLSCLEYVVVHELVHLLEPSHNHRFKAFMDQFLPDWRQRKTLLNSRL